MNLNDLLRTQGLRPGLSFAGPPELSLRRFLRKANSESEVASESQSAYGLSLRRELHPGSCALGGFLPGLLFDQLHFFLEGGEALHDFVHAHGHVADRFHLGA